MADTVDLGLVLREEKQLLSESEAATLGNLIRRLDVSREWLCGFLSALEASGIVEPRTIELYALVEERK